MKRFYSFLSLLLLMFAGVTGAVAQKYVISDEPFTTTDEVVSQAIALSPLLGTDSSSKGTGYFSTGGTLSLGVDETSVFQFEKATDVPAADQVEGYDLYYLKNVASGQYVKNPALITDKVPDDGSLYERPIYWTTEQSEAMLMTVCVADSSDTSNRGYAQHCSLQDLSVPAFVLVYNKTVMGYGCNVGGEDLGRVYLSSYYGGALWYFPYTDSNAWQIWGVQKLEGVERITETLNTYFQSGITDKNYPSGSKPGYYIADSVAKAKAVYDEAQALIEAGEATAEQTEDICARIKAAYEMLQSEGALVPMAEGYYMIYTTGSTRYIHTSFITGEDGLIDLLTVTDGYEAPTPLDKNAVGYIWKLTKTSNANYYRLQNLRTGNYISGDFIDQNISKAAGYETDGYDRCDFIANSNTADSIHITALPSAGAGIWYLETTRTDTPSGLTGYHTNHANGVIINWNGSDGANCWFRFVPVAEADFAGVVEDAQKEALNEQLQDLYDNSYSAYWRAILATGAPKGEGFVDEEGALIANASQVFSTTTETSEGSLENLVDGVLPSSDTQSYWHSTWSTSLPTGVKAYIGVDLGEAVADAVEFKLAKRSTQRLYPEQLNIYASNDTTGAWTFLAKQTVNWTDSIAGYAKNIIGYCGVAYEGSYRFFKLELAMNEVTGSEAGYFALSELNAFKATQDKSKLDLVPAELTAALTKELTAAKAELDAETPTTAQYDALYAAYKAFIAAVPDPSVLTDAIAAAQTVLNAITDNMISDAIGYYTQDAVTILGTAIDEAIDYDTTGKTAAEINAEAEKLNAAVETFKASFNMPTTGAYYTFRGASEVYLNGAEASGLNAYNAPVYVDNAALQGSMYFTRGAVRNDEGGYDVSTVATKDKIADTITVTDDLRYIWQVEEVSGNTIALRNVGTGLYLAPLHGSSTGSTGVGCLSKEKTLVTLALPTDTMVGKFVIDCGDGHHLNTGNSTQIITWTGSDGNNHFMFKAVDAQNLADATTARFHATANVYQIITLPVSVCGIRRQDGTAYSLLGQNNNNQLVLAAYETSEGDEVIPAGTPFIYKANAQQISGYARFSYYFAGDDLANDGSLTYATDPVETAGLRGTLCESDTISSEGFAYFDAAGTLTGTTADSKVSIPVQSGFFTGTLIKNVTDAGDATIDLGDISITHITDANVVVLPTTVNVYSINGALLRSNVKATNAVRGLPAGIYVVGGQKVLVK